MVFDKVKNKLEGNWAFATLFFLNIVLFFIDFITTWMNRDILQHVELNPLYAVGGLAVPILLNIVVGFFFWWYYTTKRASPSTRFFAIAILCGLLLLRTMAVYNALEWHGDPQRVENAQKVTAEQRTASAQSYAFLIYAPIAFAMLTFYIWKQDHHTTRKNISHNRQEHEKTKGVDE